MNPPRITDAGYVVSTNGGFSRHAHADWCEFHLFTRGQGEFVNGDSTLRAHEGSLVFTHPATPHSFRCLPGATLSFYFINFTADDDLRLFLHGCGPRLPVSAALATGLQCAPLFESVRRRWERRTEAALASASHLLMSFLHDIAGSDPQAHASHPAVERAIAAMRERIQGSLDLAGCAAAAGVGKPYLMRLFRQQVGMSPMQYYLRLKADTARYLLTATDEPVRAIANRLGFWDEFHFSRTFKRIVGMAPRDYRRAEAAPGRMTKT